VLPETTLVEALVIAERIRGKISELKCSIGTEVVSVTVSIGLVEWNYENRSLSLERLLQLADEKLYRAKAMGRNQVVS